MPQTWEQFVGQVVDGNFPLVQLLGGSESAAVFLTERRDGDRIVKAAIKLIPAAPENSELQLSRWRRAAGLSHPHLIRLFETGSCELGGMTLLYVVMESAEENLAQVLSDRALTAAETRAMLEPLLDALGYLHAQGFVHGHIKPASIMAIGDELKLSSEGFLRAGEPFVYSGTVAEPQAGAYAYAPPESLPGFIPPAKAVSPAGDVWSLGVTLVEVLTQHLPAIEATGHGNDPQVPPDLPEPFLDIARHCLPRNPDDRWTLSQIAARLENLSPVRQIRTPARPSEPATRPHAMPVKRRSYAVPVAVAAILAAILLVPKLFRHNSETTQAPAAALREPATQPTSTAREPLPAENGATLRPAADGSAPGEVVERVLPDVPQSARNTIQGTVRVTVRVDVDPAGEVQFAELQNRGPSQYFASLAMQSAQHWGFRPPKVSGQNILSTWTLRFEFTRAGTTVIPTQEIP